MNSAPLLDISDLCVAFSRSGQWIDVVRDVNLTIDPLETYGLIGESGCGKSTLGSAIMGYLPKNGRISTGSVYFSGGDLVRYDDEQLRSVRGRQIAMVYQNPFGALNPSLRVIDQLLECLDMGEYSSLDEARESCHAWLRKLHMPDPERVGNLYPHNLSGGMLQRIVIAMAMLLGARLLVLDEPTTALDTTVQAETLDILIELKRERAVTMLLISHDLAALAQVCDRIGVMYAGEIVEEGPLDSIINAPKHPYTASLLRCIPGLHSGNSKLMSIPGFLPSPEALPAGCIFEPRCKIRGEKCKRVHPEVDEHDNRRRVRCFYPDKVKDMEWFAEDKSESVGTDGDRYDQPPLLKVDSVDFAFGDTVVLKDISLAIGPAETVALVGESGSGKSTLAMTLVGLLQPKRGRMTFDGQALPAALGRRSRAQKRLIQMVFQSADHTLNPSRRINYILGRAISLLRTKSDKGSSQTVHSLLKAVSLPDSVARTTPRRLSGGQRQRVAIARAFSGEPRLIVLDEPTSALDVSAQASIINLLTSLQERTGCSYLFITHDLAVARYMAHKVAVLYLGVLVDVGSVEEIFHAPIHPYTEALISAIPSVSERKIDKRIHLRGENPGPRHRPLGCPFNTRCPYAYEKCATEFPGWQKTSASHQYLCWIEPDKLMELQNAKWGSE